MQILYTKINKYILVLFKNIGIIGIIFSLLIGAILFSCQTIGVENNTQEQGLRLGEPVNFDLEKIKERGSLIAIIDNSSTGYFIYRGQPMGYEYELLTRLANKLNVDLKLNITADIGEAFRKLNKGEGDIIAHNLAVTKQRKKFVAFTEHHNEVKQVLVQRKPDNWRSLKRHQIEDSLIRSPIDLGGETIHVRKNSAYFSRLQNLSEEIGENINIIERESQVQTENLIREVANGEIDYTVADEDVALVNSTYYANIDVKTPVSLPQKIAWATRPNAPDLLNAVNEWIRNMKKEAEYYVLYQKYFKSPKASLRRVRSNFSTLGGDKLSPYDTLIKAAADSLGWDWRLLAAQIYQESKFDPKAVSWAGAVGLMQLIPETAGNFGITDLYNPRSSVKAGRAYLKWLDNLWEKFIPNSQERIKFVLASYNVGQGHVLDARRLARKYGNNPNVWEGVAYYLEQKANQKFYNDPVVEYGYCRGSEPVNYVNEILERYRRYQQLMPAGESSSSGEMISYNPGGK